jgi:hypothetical protein
MMYRQFLDSSVIILYRYDKINIHSHTAQDSQTLAGSPDQARELLSEYVVWEEDAELGDHDGHS